jgi:hypothetical protein
MKLCNYLCVSVPVYGWKYMKENRSRTSSKALHVTLHSYVIVMFYNA